MSLTSAINTTKAAFRNMGDQSSVISTNIANDGNENYVRRSAVVTNTIFGASTVVTQRNQQLALLLQTVSTNSQSKAQSTLLDGLETLKSSLGGNEYELAPSTYMSTLQSSLQAFAASPGQLALAQTVVTDALDVANSLNRVSTTVQNLRADADAEIESQVAELNRLLADFKTANDTVVQATATGNDPSNALDTRETILKEISGIVGVSVVVRENNDVALYTADGTTLFETIPRSVSFSRTYTYSATVNGNAVYIDGVAVEAGVGGNTSGEGSLAALLQLRDDVAPTFQNQLDEVARGLIEAFQETDAGGANPLPGLFTWPAGTVPASGTLEPGLAASITINSALVTSSGGDPTLLRDGGINGVAYVKNPTGGSGYSDLLLTYVENLSTSRPFDPAAGLDTSSGLLTFSTNSIGWLEELRANATTATDNKTALYERAFQVYSSKTGVSLDEELSLLLDVEQSYKASAKLVSTIDSMMQAVLDMAG